MVVPWAVPLVLWLPTRLFQKHDIRVVSEPVKTLQQTFPSPKSGPPIKLQTSVVYKISCGYCPWSYVAETFRCSALKLEKKNHKECEVWFQCC